MRLPAFFFPFQAVAFAGLANAREKTSVKRLTYSLEAKRQTTTNSKSALVLQSLIQSVRFLTLLEAGKLDCELIHRSFSEVFPRLGLSASGLTAVRADAACLGFDDASLGLVFCFSTLHHLEDPTRCLKEIHRVLRPGGVFLCAREPIQPTWRRSRKPTDCPEVWAGLIENVYHVDEYEAMIAGVFEDFISMPYNDLRIPVAVPLWLRPLVARIFNHPRRQRLRRFIYTRLGGQDYSALAFKPSTGDYRPTAMR